ncbi:hypothetical protein FQZ97_901290 [compost metagenome]
MGADGRAGAVHILIPDRVVDALVLQVHAPQVHQAIRILGRGGGQAYPRKDTRTERIHDFGEVAVLGRQRDLAVELEVGVGGILPGLDGFGEGIQGGLHADQIRLRAARRRDGRSLGLDADAQLQQRDGVAQGAQLLGPDAERGALVHLQHEGADTVAGLRQVDRLQVGDRLAHHGAADAELVHEGRFLGQLFTRRVVTVADAPHQHMRQFGGERARLAAAGQIPVHRGYPDRGSDLHLLD